MSILWYLRGGRSSLWDGAMVVGWQSGFMVGPALAGQLVSLDAFALPASGIVGVALAGVMTLRLERTLPSEHRGTPRARKLAA